jgi:preprotein translocase subunit YajC
MFATIMEASTFAYMLFLAGLFTYRVLRPQARKSRKLRKRIRQYTVR